MKIPLNSCYTGETTHEIPLKEIGQWWYCAYLISITGSSASCIVTRLLEDVVGQEVCDGGVDRSLGQGEKGAVSGPSGDVERAETR